MGNISKDADKQDPCDPMNTTATVLRFRPLLSIPGKKITCNEKMLIMKDSNDLNFVLRTFRPLPPPPTPRLVPQTHDSRSFQI